MPRLANARMEAFAFALSQGRTQGAAYEEAGYQPNDGAASRLAKNVKVRGRIHEIHQVFAAAAIVTVEQVTRHLIDLALTSAARAHLDGAAAISAARGCWETIARINGLLSDKATLTVNMRLEDMSDAQLLAIAARGLLPAPEAEGDPAQPH